MFLWAEVTVSALGNWVGSGAAELLGLLTIYGMVSFSRSTVRSKRGGAYLLYSTIQLGLKHQVSKSPSEKAF